MKKPHGLSTLHISGPIKDVIIGNPELEVVLQSIREKIQSLDIVNYIGVGWGNYWIERSLVSQIAAATGMAKVETMCEMCDLISAHERRIAGVDPGQSESELIQLGDNPLEKPIPFVVLLMEGKTYVTREAMMPWF